MAEAGNSPRSWYRTWSDTAGLLPDENRTLARLRGAAERSVRPDTMRGARIGMHLGDVVEESDGDLLGDGINIAARLEVSPARRYLPLGRCLCISLAGL